MFNAMLLCTYNTQSLSIISNKMFILYATYVKKIFKKRQIFFKDSGN